MARGRVPAGRRTVAAPALLLVVLVFLATGCGAVGGSTGSTMDVRTPGGVLRGLDDGTTHRFLGIRYAQAPAGPRRWAAPVPTGPWNGTVDATAPGASCPQVNPTPGVERQDEDCLFVNVTTPGDVRPGERLPVFVWWHGGGYLNGSGAAYDARRLAEQGRIVVVTANYRLGTLGYLGLPGLPGSGAFGFADQVRSLQWTRDNIAAFGGDPTNLMVAGESAGGAATCALLGSPALTGFGVRHVAVMSGACSTRFPENGLGLRQPPRGFYRSTSDADADGAAAAASVGCPPPDAVGCLRALPVSALLPLSDRFTALAYGNDLLPADPATRLPAVPRSVSVIYGGTHDEARAFFSRVADARPQAFTPALYYRLLTEGFGPAAPRVLTQYPLAAYGNSAAHAWSTVVTDRSWSCAAHRDQQTLADAGVPTYAYELSLPEGPPGAGGIPTGGAPHARDLGLLFDVSGRTPPAAEAPLARQAVDYWSSFARTGVPVSDSAPAWPALQAGIPVTPLQLDPRGIRTVDAAAEHRCAFWSTVGS